VNDGDDTLFPSLLYIFRHSIFCSLVFLKCIIYYHIIIDMHISAYIYIYIYQYALSLLPQPVYNVQHIDACIGISLFRRSSISPAPAFNGDGDIARLSFNGVGNQIESVLS
jgi:hypothetical protein